MEKKRKGRKHRAKISDSSKKILITVIIWISAALVAVLLALTVGNALGDAADSLKTEDAAPPIYEYIGEPAPPVNAFFLNIEGKNNDSVRKTLANLPVGADVSIVLRDADGSLNYRSSVAFGVTGDAGGACDLTGVVRDLKANGGRVSACFYSSLESAPTVGAKYAVIDYEAALIAEAFGAGVEDIVIINLPSDSEGAAYASRLFYEVRERCDNACLGAAISYRDVSSEKVGAFELYHEFADFLALNTVDAPVGTTAAGIASEMLYYFERYPLRVLMHTAEGNGREAQRIALATLGIYNVQSIGSQQLAG